MLRKSPLKMRRKARAKVIMRFGIAFILWFIVSDPQIVSVQWQKTAIYITIYLLIGWSFFGPLLAKQLKALQEKYVIVRYIVASIRILLISVWALIVLSIVLDGIVSQKIMNGSISTLSIFLLLYLVFRAWKLKNQISREIAVARSPEQANNEDSPMGSSRFLSAHEAPISLKLSQLGTANGIVFGVKDRFLLCRPSSSQGHTLVLGAPGEGKSACHVIPTLLSWKGSAVVIDIKGELYQKTSKYRQKFSRVIRFNPTGNASRYNPIDACSTVFEAQDLARTLIPEPQDGDPFWAQAAQGIFTGAIIEGNKNGMSLSDVCARVVETPITQLVDELKASEYREVRLMAGGFADLPDKAIGGVAGEMRSKLLTLATEEDVIRATSMSDFKISDLEEPTTLYLTIPEAKLVHLRPLWTAVIQQIIRHLQDRGEEATVPVLLMLDEFASLGRLPDFDVGLATLRSRNVHFSIIIQSFAQLDDRYGEDVRRIITDNCGYKLILSANDSKTQESLSNMAGQRTAWSSSATLSYGGGGGGDFGSVVGAVMGSASESNSEQSVPLIRPEEFGRLGDDAILFQPKIMPMRIQRLYWFKNAILKERVEK